MRLTLNGEAVDLDARSDEMLLGVLRADGLLSVRETCGIGVCGACTVLLDGAPVSGCLVFARAAEGREVTTVEGLGGDDAVQRAFASGRAFQCGYCTPGMILTAKAFLAETPSPTEDEIRVALAGNLCRCGSYVKIIEAIKEAAT